MAHSRSQPIPGHGNAARVKAFGRCRRDGRAPVGGREKTSLHGASVLPMPRHGVPIAGHPGRLRNVPDVEPHADAGRPPELRVSSAPSSLVLSLSLSLCRPPPSSPPRPRLPSASHHLHLHTCLVPERPIQRCGMPQQRRARKARCVGNGADCLLTRAAPQDRSRAPAPHPRPRR